MLQLDPGEHSTAQAAYQAINSLMADCGLPSNFNPDVVVTADDAASEATLLEFKDVIGAIAKTKTFTVNCAGAVSVGLRTETSTIPTLAFTLCRA